MPQSQFRCFSIAATLARVCCRFPDFFEIVHAQMIKTCIFVAPCYRMPNEGESIQEFQAAKAAEVSEKHVEKMSAVIALYATLTTIKLPSTNRFIGLEHAWTWMARFLVTEPEYTSCELLLTFLKVFVRNAWCFFFFFF